jgi:hypothetical protein
MYVKVLITTVVDYRQKQRAVFKQVYEPT